MRRGLGALGCAVVALTLSSCATAPEEPAGPSAAPEFADGTTMSAIAQSGAVRIGVKTDQPGLGYAPDGTAEPEGFDVEIAKIIATSLDLPEDAIQWVPVSSVNRESLIKNNQVDVVVASFSITDERRASVGQAGPYFLTGQQIMTRADDTSISSPEDLAGKTICQVAGSQSADELVDKYGANTGSYNSYELCVDALLAGDLDAVSTDGAILQGFASLYPDDLRIVGEPFSTERYGIGYRHGDADMCAFLTETLMTSYDNGSWRLAFESTLGADGVEAPVPPRPDPCEGA